MENQPQNPQINNTSPAQPAPQQPLQPVAQQPVAPVNQPQIPPPGIMPSQPKANGLSKNKRITSIVLGVIVLAFALSIVQGQVSHGFDTAGIIMILVFGIPGAILLLAGIFKK